jgi:hypothetical protein
MNASVPNFALGVFYPDDMRAFVKYECDPSWSWEEVQRELKGRWAEPWPAARTINQWREQARAEQEACRRQVWEREFASRARYLVPKCLVSLDKSLTAAVETLEEARERKDDKITLRAATTVKDIAGEMLTHLGAPSHEAAADPEAIKREALAALMSAGKSAEEAETLFSSLALAVGNAALSPGE